MGKFPSIKDHPYAPEFAEVVSLFQFSAWMIRTAQGVVNNLYKTEGVKSRPLYQWIDIFLAWSEYQDFLEWKEEVESRRND